MREWQGQPDLATFAGAKIRKFSAAMFAGKTLAPGASCKMSTFALDAYEKGFGLAPKPKLDGGKLPDAAEVLEEVDDVLQELIEIASNGVPIIVEGDKDIKSLKELGVRGNFEKISGKRTLLNFLEGLSRHKEVIILTDFDRTGEKLLKFCEKHLKTIGVKPNTDFWKKIRDLLMRDVKDIEGLAGFLKKRREISACAPTRQKIY